MAVHLDDERDPNGQWVGPEAPRFGPHRKVIACPPPPIEPPAAESGVDSPQLPDQMVAYARLTIG